ncbi:MAG: glucokinase [Chloroflexi bacterium]|nr:glucokinase [Chloroflexota bacterium]
MASTKKQKRKTGLLLAGDIGATNTRVALFDPEGDLRKPTRVNTYAGADYPGLVEVLRDYLKGSDTPVVAACFGAAGPVVEGQVSLTNINWVVNSAELCAKFGWQFAWLINDLKAIANAIPLLEPDELKMLNAGIPEKHGTIAVIAPGTGLGIGYLTWAAGRYRAYATEGGHADFAPVNAIQDEMLGYLRGKFKQVAIEHVCGGVGLPNIYEFLKASGRAEEPAWLANELVTSPDPTPVIVDNAMAAKPGSEICQQTMEIFITVLAGEAGSLALQLGATGGIYIGGGIPPRILPAFERYGFMQTFLAKTGYEYYLERFPVNIILHPEPGLLGAADYGVQQLHYPEGV